MDPKIDLVGGHLRIRRQTFVIELLRPNNILKKLISRKEIGYSPQIEDNESQECITLKFNESRPLPLDEYYSDYFKDIKAHFKNDISGKLTVRITSYSTFYTDIDL